MSREDFNSIHGEDIRGTHVAVTSFPENSQNAIRRLEAAERVARRLGEHEKANKIRERKQGVADRQHH